MGTRSRTWAIVGIVLAVALLAGLALTARQNSARPSQNSTAPVSAQNSTAPVSARADVAQSGVFRQIAEAQTPMVVNIRTETRQQTRDLTEFFGGQAFDRSVKFDEWLKGAITASPAERDRLLTQWESAPFARYCHPREEHLIPLMVIAGAAGSDVGAVTWSGAFMGTQQTGYHFG